LQHLIRRHKHRVNEGGVLKEISNARNGELSAVDKGTCSRKRWAARPFGRSSPADADASAVGSLALLLPLLLLLLLLLLLSLSLGRRTRYCGRPCKKYLLAQPWQKGQPTK